MMTISAIDRLLSLPAGAAARFADMEPSRADGLFVASDPPGRQLGSGGGTAHLLVEAWKQGAGNRTAGFSEWISHARKLIVHGSGQSRRLPAYAPAGKPMLPLPALKHVPGQRPDQVLFDLQSHTYARLFWHAPERYRVMVTCGDVLIRFEEHPPVYPDVDVLIVGIEASPEEARRHGVMVCAATDNRQMQRFLQKPSAAALEAIAPLPYYLDTGIWLLSRRALDVLMAKCGWNPEQETFRGTQPDFYDLFSAFGPALGATPAQPDDAVSPLSSAVLPIPDGRFYHFGTNSSIFTSVAALRDPMTDKRSFGHGAAPAGACNVVLHAEVPGVKPGEARGIWVENASIPKSWGLAERHVLTGVPRNDWTLDLAPGVCLDFVPLRNGRLCIRHYGYDDAFRGAMDDPSTPWHERPAKVWFERRGMDWAAAGIAPTADIQVAPIFITVDPSALDANLIQWLCDEAPPPDGTQRARWLASDRLSANDLLVEADVAGLSARRRAHIRSELAGMSEAAWLQLCTSADLAAVARLHAESPWPLPSGCPEGSLSSVHDCMFRYVIAKTQGDDRADSYRRQAFAGLRRCIVEQMEVDPVKPRRDVLEDQIVWGRSPVRLDLAGGWSDTPPYCLESGGKVVNVAVDLNGQPPIHAFARICPEPHIVLRSIDLGIQETIETYDDLQRKDKLGSGFGIARAALALCGFDSRFRVGPAFPTLARQLESDFGGGIELSMVCAVPKGSGLGTSSILAATLLGTLGELSGLHWGPNDLFTRTLALEQMLTSGGGWQDQVGGILHGLKLTETQPGLNQATVVRWLPDHRFREPAANSLLLLYYTGITRVAHDILGEIVQDLFLNASRGLNIIDEIKGNAVFAADAIQRDDWDGICECVRRSWRLNQLLDRGTNPPEVQGILSEIDDLTAASKLLGAGGGGYLLILARDEAAAQRIRARLRNHPPNARARFVDMSLSDRGLQITRS